MNNKMYATDYFRHDAKYISLDGSTVAILQSVKDNPEFPDLVIGLLNFALIDDELPELTDPVMQSAFRSVWASVESRIETSIKKLGKRGHGLAEAKEYRFPEPSQTPPKGTGDVDRIAQTVASVVESSLNPVVAKLGQMADSIMNLAGAQDGFQKSRSSNPAGAQEVAQLESSRRATSPEARIQQDSLTDIPTYRHTDRRTDPQTDESDPKIESPSSSSSPEGGDQRAEPSASTEKPPEDSPTCDEEKIFEQEKSPWDEVPLEAYDAPGKSRRPRPGVEAMEASLRQRMAHAPDHVFDERDLNADRVTAETLGNPDIIVFTRHCPSLAHRFESHRFPDMDREPVIQSSHLTPLGALRQKYHDKTGAWDFDRFDLVLSQFVPEKLDSQTAVEFTNDVWDALTSWKNRKFDLESTFDRFLKGWKRAAS